MDKHDFDGLGRSSSLEKDYVLDGYVTESCVPSTIEIGPCARAEAPRLKSAGSKKEALAQRNGKDRAEAFALPPIIGSSAKAKQIRDLISLYAEDDSPVLISGETGVGKELIARHLHAFSRRGKYAFSALNAGAVPETLAASELFGHAKGAFTGAIGDHEGAIAQADRGVLFLDEIGETPLPIQTHLLRVLEDGVITKIGGKAPFKVDFRLIAATNAPLRDHVKNNRFRCDLYYRINVLSIEAPPLRERGDDVVEIADAMIANHKEERYRSSRLTPKAADRLKSHSFPGNVRELRNVLARALVHARGGKILPEHLLFEGQACADARKIDLFDIDEAKSLVSRFVMMKALYASQGNVTKAAKLTGRSRGTLHSLKRSIEGEEFASAFQKACAEMKVLLNGC